MTIDTKKVQTIINVCGEQMQIIRDALAVIQAMNTLFQSANPNVSGTPLQGNVAALGSALASLQAEADSPIWTGLINAVVRSHRNQAL